jgi:dTDP-4-dehydrorhamnose 3,5-epimerase
MIFGKTPLAGAYAIELEPLGDDRGLFARYYCDAEFLQKGVSFRIAQSSISFNKQQGTLRGMHFQKYPKAEAKLVRCTRGAVYDVIIDLRVDSPTYCEWVAMELTGANRKMMYVPQGFAHGFQTLADDTELEYQISESYSAEHADGVRWNDPCFSIKWPLEVTSISARDMSFPDYSK